MKICKISLISLIAVFSINMPADARVNVKSTGRGNVDAYNQMAAIRNQQAQQQVLATTASDTGDLPVAVEDKNLAESILNNSSENVTMADLEACSMIYPSGVFKWAVPESGIRLNKTSQCVAVVELRDANTNAVLATTTLAAGDMMKCNIDEFPQNGWLPALEKVELPADAAPTLEQVEAVMNEEQKQNAGIKIAATAILGGLAGNLLAPKEAGDNKLFGTGKTQLADTAIGIATGAGIGAASTYSGKVAGDTIKSTAVNAASGMVVGNMLAGAAGEESSLATVKCTPEGGTEHDCIAGTLKEMSAMTFADWEKANAPISESDPEIITLVKENGLDVTVCYKTSESSKLLDCQPRMNNLTHIYVEDKNGSGVELKRIKTKDLTDMKRYVMDNSEYVSTDNGGDLEGKPIYYVVSNAKITSGKERHAYAVFSSSLPSKAFGYEEWDDVSGFSHTFYVRNPNGSVGAEIKDTGFTFEPLRRDASDGALVDLSNASRTKGTLAGTAVGGALGGFSGYQGAKNEITERWLAEQRNYEGSLSNFYCATGNRFLSQYNSYAEIPNYTKPEE